MAKISKKPTAEMRFLHPDRKPGINYWGWPDRKGKSQMDELTDEEPTPLMRDLRNMTGFNHVGCTAHDAVECIRAYREAVEQMLAHENGRGMEWWKGWVKLKAVYYGQR